MRIVLATSNKHKREKLAWIVGRYFEEVVPKTKKLISKKMELHLRKMPRKRRLRFQEYTIRTRWRLMAGF